MAVRIVNETSLTAVADAIRERAGTTEAMEFPNGFVSALERIPDYLEMLITGTLNSYENSNVTALVRLALSYTKTTKSFSFPNVVTVGEQVFYWSDVESLSLPKCESFAYESLCGTKKLKTLRLPKMKSIGWKSFASSGIISLILPCENGIPTAQVDSFTDSEIAKGNGHIYVPARYVDTIKAATNWSALASQVRAIEDYPDITGG